MKKLVFMIAAMVLVSIGVSAQVKSITRFEGKEISGITAWSAFNVIVTNATQSFAKVEIPAKFEQYLTFELTTDGMLRVGLDGNKIPRATEAEKNQFKVYVNTNKLNRVQGSGATDFRFTGDFAATGFKLQLSGSSDAKGLVLRSQSMTIETSGASGIEESNFTVKSLTIQSSGASELSALVSGVTTLNCKVTGASKAELKGDIASAVLSANSASNINLEQCTLGKVQVEAKSASGIKLGVVKELDALANSAATIHYTGDPNPISTKTSSAGAIKKY